MKKAAEAALFRTDAIEAIHPALTTPFSAIS